MTDDFVPASSLAPIPGSSYSLRIGKIGDKWAIRVYRGQQILTTEVIGDLDPQVLVTVAQSAISLPSYSPYHIARAVSPLIREAKSGYISPQPPQPTSQVNIPRIPQVNGAGSRGTPASTLQTAKTTHEESSVPSPALERATPPPTAKPVEKRRPLLEIPPLEELRTQKKLALESVSPEQLAERVYSTLMTHLGLVVAYVYNNYGEKSAARMWQHLEEVAELSQSRRKKESFEDFIRRRAEEDLVLGIEHDVTEFYDNKFASRVKSCKFKNSMGEIEKSGSRFLEDLPCMLCKSTWQGSCKAMGFNLQLAREKDGCTIRVEKTESKR